MKTRKRFQSMLQLSLFAFAFLIASVTKVNAADLTTPTGIWQDGATETAIRIAYTGAQSYTNYDIQISKDGGKTWQDVQATLGQNSTNENTAIVNNLEAGNVYYVRVRAHLQNTESVSEYTTPYKVVTEPAAMTSVPTQTGAAKATTGTVTYGSSKGAAGYEIDYISYSDLLTGGSWKFAGETTATSYTIKGLKKDNYYIATVVPYAIANADNPDTTKRWYAYGEYALAKNGTSVKTLPAAIKGLENLEWKPESKTLSVVWKQGAVADGYELIFYNNKGKKVKTADVAAGSTSYCYYDFGKAGKSTSVKVKARAYVKVAGKKYYSAYTKPIYCVSQPKIKQISSGTGYLKLEWKKVTGATGYDIYIGKSNKKSAFKKVKSVGKNTTSFTTSSFKGSKISRSGSYYFYIVAKKKAGGKTYKSVPSVVTYIS
ncbi:MAG: fibronectin type III domain-containing protein [Lachnospiraceae bacterium]|nr:fibronectin type III domain-containing protein [Lachnospiraceae bacterium]